MSQQRHVIKKQYLDLRIGSNIEAFELQNQVSALYRSKIIPLLEVYCDRLSEPDSILRIDTLDIDLGEIDLQTLETDFVTAVEKYLFQQLTKKIDSLIKSPADQSPPLTKVAKQPSLADPTASRLELLNYFLQTGRLSWWCDTLSQSALEDCCDHLLKVSPVALKVLLQTKIKHIHALRRLIYQFSDQTLTKLVALLAPIGSQWVSPYLRDMQVLMPQVDSFRGINFQQFRLKLWQGIFGPLSLGSTFSGNVDLAIQNQLLQLATSFQLSASTLRQDMLGALEQLHTEGVDFNSELPTILTARSQTTVTPRIRFQSEIEHLISLLTVLKNFNNEHPLSLSLQANIDTLLRQLFLLLQDAAKSPSINAPHLEIAALVTSLEQEMLPDYHSLGQQIKAVAQSIKFSASAPESLTASALFNEPSDSFNKSDEIYVQNAGLILLWPFLNRFFETLSLLRANQFVNDWTASQAILLLQYLVDKSVEIPEYQLPLNKLLCGVDLLVPVAARLEISELAKTECNTLLTAVIHNWSVLKSMTPDGFRHAFLQRAGILRRHNANWLLQTERETYDVLLDQLPWSIQVIKLPWMEQVLYTEW
ncbi:MAG: contractile injection system tape measure protein [Cyanobacteria bacterium P01_H01_bin.21]